MVQVHRQQFAAPEDTTPICTPPEVLNTDTGECEVPEPPPGDNEAVAPQVGVPSCLPGEVFNPATGICEVTPPTESGDQPPNNGGIPSGPPANGETDGDGDQPDQE